MEAGSLIVAVVTFALFIAALFTKGLTHDLFLEAGVFLVSVKIIVLSQNNRAATLALERKVDAVLAALAHRKHADGGSAGTGSRARDEG